MVFLTRLVATISLLVASMTLSLSAHAVAFGLYTLSNHPDGGIAPPLYGLRLDGLLTGPGNSEHYTFDFDHADSAMFLNYQSGKISIYGSAFGGEDAIGQSGCSGNGSDGDNDGYCDNTTAIWDIEFEYIFGVGVENNFGPGDLQDAIVKPGNDTNTGSLTSALGTFDLEDKAASSGKSFRLGDKGNGNGHRSFPGISGWGWVNHGEVDVNGNSCVTDRNCSHIAASDWLFTATAVPVPGAVWLFGTVLLGLAAFNSRKRV